MNKSFSQSGFSIIEIMVVLMIVSIVGIGFASYLFQQSKSTNENQAKQEFSTLQNNVLNCTSSANCLLQSESLSK